MSHSCANRSLRKETRALLESLGNSPSSVAGSLATLGITGAQRDSGSCVITGFLSAIVGAERRVGRIEVFRRVVVVTRRRPQRWTIVRLPETVRLFVAAFDSGLYPSLVRTAEQPPSGEPVSRAS